MEHNKPSEVQNLPWVYVSSFKLSKTKGESWNSELAGVIISHTVRISEEKSGFVIPLDDEELIVPFDVEAIDKLAVKSGIRVGKWLVYKERSDIDRFWEIIAKATINGILGNSAKVSTKQLGSDRHVICIYTDDYLDLDDVNRVRDELDTLGFTERLCYKPDIYTYLGIYYRTTPLSACRYRK
ncbi:MAG: putative phosphothreonine lyase domain-containing protein [Candidatus Hodarchaeota archaeon]